MCIFCLYFLPITIFIIATNQNYFCHPHEQAPSVPFLGESVAVMTPSELRQPVAGEVGHLPCWLAKSLKAASKKHWEEQLMHWNRNSETTAVMTPSVFGAVPTSHQRTWSHLQMVHYSSLGQLQKTNCAAQCYIHLSRKTDQMSEGSQISKVTHFVQILNWLTTAIIEMQGQLKKTEVMVICWAFQSYALFDLIGKIHEVCTSLSFATTFLVAWQNR